ESIVSALERLVAEERFGARLTVVSGEGLGKAAVLDLEDGLVAGELPPDAEVALDDAAVLVDRERPATLAYGDTEALIEPVLSRARLGICGAVRVDQGHRRHGAL